MFIMFIESGFKLQCFAPLQLSQSYMSDVL